MHAEQNYIYIIFAALYIIYSIVKAVRGNKQQKPVSPQKQGQPAQPVRPPVSSPVPNPGDEMKKMLEDLFGGTPEVNIPEKQVVKPRPQPVVAKPVPAKIVPKHPPKAKLSSQPSKPVTSQAGSPHFVAHPEIISKVFTEPDRQEEEAPIDFDIRQAVLYSEILKRPNW